MDGREQRLIVHTGIRRTKEEPERAAKKRRRGWKRTARTRTFGERLMRNTALACALLLCVTALTRLNTSWSNSAVEAVRAAMTMRVDVAGALSKVAFVQKLFPETALVFWNLGTDDLYVSPVSGEITHAYSDAEPYVEFACKAGDTVSAAASGDVLAVSRGANGAYLVSIGHSDGSETRYAYLKEALVERGESVSAGDAIGISSDDGVYFELRVDSQRTNPGDFRQVMAD